MIKLGDPEPPPIVYHNGEMHGRFPKPLSPFSRTIIWVCIIAAIVLIANLIGELLT